MDMYMVMNTTRQNPEELMQNLTQAHKKIRQFKLLII